MFKRVSKKNIAVTVALILLGMLISTTLLTSYAAGRAAPVADTSSPEQTGAQLSQAQTRPAGFAAQTWTLCTPLNVAVFSTRVHVKCVESVGGVQWFAAPTANAAHAARMLSLLSTAHAAGRTLEILYDPDDLSGASIGCQTNDCRLIIAAAFLQ